MLQRSFQSYPLATFLCTYTTKHDHFALIKSLVVWASVAERPVGRGVAAAIPQILLEVHMLYFGLSYLRKILPTRH